ncbi:MAG: SCO family protein [Gemmatimonadota bacterium]|nr:SCO family protein [Gemmatimonadota bacterium]
MPQRAPGLLRRRLAAPLALLAALSVAGCGAPPADQAAAEGPLRGFEIEAPLAMPPATLVDTRGEPYDLRERTAGRITLLFFGYTHCPDVCPVHLANVAAALDHLERPVAREIEVVFVTTDPERDTRKRIRTWLDRFDRGFTGLRGNSATVAELQRELGLPPAVKEPREGEGYLVGHAAQVIAFGPDGFARARYPFGTRQADWVHDLPRLVRDGGE